MSDESSSGVVGVLIGFLFGSVVTFVLMVQNTTLVSVWHREAVEHGAAHYDKQTGEWQWNEPAMEVDE